MTYFRDRSIGIKVLIPPLILIAALGVVSLLAVYGMNRQHEALTAVNDLALDKITLVDEFTVLSEQVQSDVFRIFVLRSMALPDAEIQPVHARLQQGLSDLGVIYGEILTRWPLDPAESALLERMKGPLAAFSAQAHQAALVVTDNPSFGVLLVRSSTVPFAEFRGVLAEFLNYQQAKIVRATAVANQAADRTRNLLLAVALGTALIATLAALLISARTISRPVRAITTVMARLADGDLTIEPHGQERRDEIGAMARAVEVFRSNAIEQARLDREFRASEERYRQLFHHSPAGVFHYDAQLRITDCNERLATILQSTHQRLVGLDMQTLRDQSVLPALHAVLEGRDGLYEGPYSATTGPAQVWVALRTAPLFDQQGQVTGGMALVEEITERKRAEEEQMERVRLTTLAADVGNALTQGDALSGMLQQCAERMVQHLDLAFARIWTLDPTDKVLELQTSAGMYTHTDGLHRRVPVGQLKIGLIAQERRPHLTNQVIGDPRVPDQEWAQREGMVAFAGYPLIAEGRLVGVMAMFARHPLTDLAFERLMSIADSIALGIQQKRAKGALRRRNAYLVALQETSLDLISQFDLNTLLENIVKRAGQLMGTSAGYLDLVEPGTDQLKPMVGLGALTESLQFASKHGEGVAGTVWQTGQPLVIDDYDAWAGRIGGFSRSAIRAIIGVPLIAGTEILGVLGLAYDATTDRTFDQEAVELATQFARLATLAIENARLFATAQQELAERNQAEAKVHLTLAELSRSNAELEQFAYVASHDLQEPLRMVTSYLQLIERRYGDRLDGDAREFMGYAVDGANRMKALINDLLAYSRVGTHGKPFGAVDCATSLAQATANLRVAIAENAAVVTHDPLPTVTGDAGQLTQLFQNLIGNAIKFHGAEPPVVHVSACLGEGIRDRGLRPQSPIPNPQSPCWVFSVRDNGIGMAPQSFDRIFVIFQRLHLRDEYPGTGIGLAVCKKIVERHGGAIWVESAPGQGATFWFTIPA